MMSLCISSYNALGVPDTLSGARLTRRKAAEARLASAGGALGEDGDGISRFIHDSLSPDSMQIAPS
jgi:hypothetical protein